MGLMLAWRQAAILAVLFAGWPAVNVQGRQAAEITPLDPTRYTWIQHPGAQVPLQTPFMDESGKPASLASLAGGKPIILDLGYFHCPSLCGVTRADLFSALQQSTLRPGQDYTLLSISIDPAETQNDAAVARRSDTMPFPLLQAAGLHYLTGHQPSIAAIEQSVGFRAHYEKRYRQFLHPSGLVFLTSTGVISSYLLGVGYRAGDINAALVQARSGSIARAALPILLLCFHFDSHTGRYTLAIFKVLRLMGILAVALIATMVIALSRPPKTR